MHIIRYISCIDIEWQNKVQAGLISDVQKVLGSSDDSPIIHIIIVDTLLFKIASIQQPHIVRLSKIVL